MHAVKVSWVGQTFALAKSNESGGKKSRIRRSKEDRKALVESFIKRYQNSNNGSFPSLNLTHKEVGGSFYTVREIVREIIQENRILGPAKPAEGEQEGDQFDEHYPLGSIFIECQHVPLSSNEILVVASNHQSINEELDSSQNGKVDDQQLQRFENQPYIDGVPVDKEYKGAEANELPVQVNCDMLHTDKHINRKLEAVEDVVEISTHKVTLATDVVVETFPIKSASKITHDVDGRSVETGTLALNREQKETKRVDVKIEISESGYSGPLDEKCVEHVNGQLIESLSSSTAQSIISNPGGKILQAEVAIKDDLTLQTTNQDMVVGGMESKPAPKVVPSKNSFSTSSGRGESLSQKEVVTKSDIQNAVRKEEGKNSTLNRTKLQSWERSSGETADEETNPVLAVFKAFISAFVKF